MSSSDRRSQVRHVIDIDATIITSSAAYSARAIDISVDGIRIVSDALVNPETDIALSLATQGEETLLSGSVLWAIEVQRKEMPPAFEMGISAEAFILKKHRAFAHADKAAMVEKIIACI